MRRADKSIRGPSTVLKAVMWMSGSLSVFHSFLHVYHLYSTCSRKSTQKCSTTCI